MNQNLIALNTIVRKEVQRFLRIWAQTLLPPVITQSLYFIIFGNFIGSRIDNGGEFARGVSYIEFVIPGLVMMAVINASFSNVVSSFFGSKFQKNLEEMQVASVPHWIMVTGFCAGGVLRGLIVGIIVFLISFFFARPSVNNIWVVLLFVILTAMVFALGGLLNGIFAKKFDDVSIFPTFILTPLTYLGGVFYSIQELPPFWQNVSKLNPIVYMIDGFRYGFYGFSSFEIWQNLGLLIIFFVLLLILNLYLLKKGVGMKN